MDNKLQALCLSLALLCAACGGGDGTSGSTSTITGVAIDGNLYLAKACLDTNVNGTCDAGEPSATTDLNGIFTIKSNLVQNTVNQYPVVVMAIASTTIDQDDPGLPIATAITMTAPPGYPSVVSPLTTLLSAKMAGGMTYNDAKKSVQNDLGLVSADDVNKNYVTGPGDVLTHYMAVAVAEVLKAVDSTNSLSAQQLFIRNTVTNSIAPISVAIQQTAVNLSDAKNQAALALAP